MIELNPRHSIECYFNRGVAYSGKGDFDRAITDYTVVLQFQPDDIPAYVNRGNIYAAKGESDLAISDYTVAIQLNPLLEMSYYNRGNVYGSRGSFDMALADFNTTIQLNPRYAKAYYGRAKVWLHEQEWEKAKVDLTGAKDMDIDIVALFHNDYQSIPDFEKQIGVKLPDDLSAMLMQQEKETRIQPMEESLFRPSSEIYRPSFEKIAEILAQQARSNPKAIHI